VDWQFNAWGGHEGGLYSSWERDDALARQVLQLEGAERYQAPFVLEGGSIHVDGEGTILVTEECLLNPNRNPHLTRAQIEALLCDYLGGDVVVWLGRGVHEDETDGHVDNLACFVAPATVLLTWPDDPADPQLGASADALRRLERATDARGRRFEVIRVPSPEPMFLTREEARGVTTTPGTASRRAGDRMAASYVNHYVGTTRVVFPLLDPSRDDRVTEILAGCYPGREVVGVQAREILLGGGGIHCITQQVPSTPS
jgi:agmatine deiminase